MFGSLMRLMTELTKRDLLDKAKEAGITGRHGMRKDELEQALRNSGVTDLMAKAIKRR